MSTAFIRKRSKNYIVYLEYLDKNEIEYNIDRTNKEMIYTRNKIRPTSGIQHPSNPHPKPPLSTTSGFAACCATPQCTQITALSSISCPQFLQNAIIFFSFSFVFPQTNVCN